MLLGNHDYVGNTSAQIEYAKTSKTWRFPATGGAPAPWYSGAVVQSTPKIDRAAGLTRWMQKVRWTVNRTALHGKQFTVWPLEANRRPWPPWRGASWRSPCRYAVTAWSSEAAVHMQINTAWRLGGIAGHILRHRTTVSGPFLIFGAL